jgi:hypothetical protein
MDLPNDCRECSLFNDEYYVCQETGERMKEHSEGRGIKCPLRIKVGE